MNSKVVSIEGMMCEHCVAHVEKALMGIDGVKKVQVSLDEKRAVVEFENEVLDEKIEKAVEDAGYKVVEIR